MNDFGKILGEILEEVRKEEEKKQKNIDTLMECAERFQNFCKQRITTWIDSGEIERLDRDCPEFAEATREGFTEEEIKFYVVTSFNFLLDPINLGKLDETLISVIAKIQRKKEFQFGEITGETVYQYVSKRKEFEELRQPLFKKKIIFQNAVEMVVEKKNISFNTAVKRAIEEFEKNKFKVRDRAKTEAMFAELAGVINPLIDLFVDNEIEILSALGDNGIK